MVTDPNLAPASQTQVPGVPPMVTTPQTPHIGNTKVSKFVVFKSPIATGSFFRPDGKKLPFIHGLFRTDIQQDIDYLDGEIATGNQYIQRALQADIDRAEMMADPQALLRKKLEAELREKIEIETEERLRRELLSQNVVLKPKEKSAAEILGVVGTDKLAGGAADSNSSAKK
jgi:hypothetical protein